MRVAGAGTAISWIHRDWRPADMEVESEVGIVSFFLAVPSQNTTNIERKARETWIGESAGKL
jgi:hypothetical protein